MKPQYEMWSAIKITVVKVIGPKETESFPNAKFKIVRGSASQARERNDANFLKASFFLADKHMYFTTFLEYSLEMINKLKGNSLGNKKCFPDMIFWYIQVCKSLLSIIPKVFEV
ncbi:unnamed protein product [Lactuca saligna]|uniref:Uncharacterized protein n=1 Tax=Lactuca saligna TaxID=75948 RepID=A0AA36E4L1_LACSI|nr:unnamed protein product [Lactuca saligna]